MNAVKRIEGLLVASVLVWAGGAWAQSDYTNTITGNTTELWGDSGQWVPGPVVPGWNDFDGGQSNDNAWVWFRAASGTVTPQLNLAGSNWVLNSLLISEDTTSTRNADGNFITLQGGTEAAAKLTLSQINYYEGGREIDFYRGISIIDRADGNALVISNANALDFGGPFSGGEGLALGSAGDVTFRDYRMAYGAAPANGLTFDGATGTKRLFFNLQNTNASVVHAIPNLTYLGAANPAIVFGRSMGSNSLTVNISNISLSANRANVTIGAQSDADGTAISTVNLVGPLAFTNITTASNRTLDLASIRNGRVNVNGGILINQAVDTGVRQVVLSGNGSIAMNSGISAVDTWGFAEAYTNNVLLNGDRNLEVILDQEGRFGQANLVDLRGGTVLKLTYDVFGTALGFPGAQMTNLAAGNTIDKRNWFVDFGAVQSGFYDLYDTNQAFRVRAFTGVGGNLSNAVYAGSANMIFETNAVIIEGAQHAPTFAEIGTNLLYIGIRDAAGTITDIGADNTIYKGAAFGASTYLGEGRLYGTNEVGLQDFQTGYRGTLGAAAGKDLEVMVLGNTVVSGASATETAQFNADTRTANFRGPGQLTLSQDGYATTTFASWSGTVTQFNRIGYAEGDTNMFGFHTQNSEILTLDDYGVPTNVTVFVDNGRVHIDHGEALGGMGAAGNTSATLHLGSNATLVTDANDILTRGRIVADSGAFLYIGSSDTRMVIGSNTGLTNSWVLSPDAAFLLDDNAGTRNVDDAMYELFTRSMNVIIADDLATNYGVRAASGGLTGGDWEIGEGRRITTGSDQGATINSIAAGAAAFGVRLMDRATNMILSAATGQSLRLNVNVTVTNTWGNAGLTIGDTNAFTTTALGTGIGFRRTVAQDGSVSLFGLTNRFNSATVVAGSNTIDGAVLVAGGLTVTNGSMLFVTGASNVIGNAVNDGVLTVPAAAGITLVNNLNQVGGASTFGGIFNGLSNVLVQGGSFTIANSSVNSAIGVLTNQAIATIAGQTNFVGLMVNLAGTTLVSTAAGDTVIGNLVSVGGDAIVEGRTNTLDAVSGSGGAVRLRGNLNTFTNANMAPGADLVINDATGDRTIAYGSIIADRMTVASGAFTGDVASAGAVIRELTNSGTAVFLGLANTVTSAVNTAGTLVFGGGINTVSNILVSAGTAYISGQSNMVDSVNLVAGTLNVTNAGETFLRSLTSAGTTHISGQSNFLDSIAATAGTINLYGGFNNVTSVTLSGGADMNVGNDATDETRIYGDVTVQDSASATTVIFSRGNNIVSNIFFNPVSPDNDRNVQFEAESTIVYGSVFIGPTNQGTGSGRVLFGDGGPESTDSTEIKGDLVIDSSGSEVNNAWNYFQRGDLIVRSNLIVNASGSNYVDAGRTYGHNQGILIEGDYDTNLTDGVGFASRLQDGTLVQGPDGIVIKPYGGVRIEVTRTNDPAYWIGQKITVDNAGPNYWFNERNVWFNADTNMILGINPALTAIVNATNVWLREGAHLRVDEGNTDVRLGLILDGPAGGTNFAAEGGAAEDFDLMNVASSSGQARVLQIGTTNVGAHNTAESSLETVLFGTGATEVTFNVFNGRLQMTNGAAILGTAQVARDGSLFDVMSGTTGYVANVSVLAGLFSNRGDLMTFDNVTVAGGQAVLDGQLSYTTNLNLFAGTGIVASAGAQFGQVTFDGGALRGVTDYVLAAEQGVRLTNIANGGAGTFLVDAGRTLSVSNVIDGDGSLIKDGSGTLVFSNVNAYTGGTTVRGGTLDLGGLDQNGSTASPVSFQGGLITNGFMTKTGGDFDAQSGEVAATLQGTAGLTKTTAGTLILSGSNAYQGITVVADGSLRLNSTQALPGGIAATGGTSALILTNGGVLGLGADDFYRNLGSEGSNVAWTGSGGFAAYGADRHVNLGGNDSTQTLTWGQANFVSGDNELVFGAADSDFTLILDNDILLNGTNRFRANNGSAFYDGRIAGNVGETSPGVGYFVKTGDGILDLTGSNWWTGGFEVLGGQLIFSGAYSMPGGAALNISNFAIIGLGGANYTNSLGTGAGQVQWTGSGGFMAIGADRFVNLGGQTQQINWGSGSFVPELVDGSVLVLGATNADSTLDFQNPINLGVESNRTVLVHDGSATVDAKLSGLLTGSGGLVKAGAGTLQLSTNNLFSGLTAVENGRLILAGSGNHITNSIGVVLGSGTTNGVLQLGDSSGASDETLKGLTTSGTGTGNRVVGGASAISTLTLDIADGVTNVYRGFLGGSSGNENNLALVKTNAGTLFLAHGNTYTGRTTIAGGAIAIGNDSALGASPGAYVANQLTLDGGTLRLTNNIALGSTRGISLGANNGTIQADTLGGNSSRVQINSVISGAGGLTKTGIGTVGLYSNNTYSGDTVVAGGVLVLYSATALRGGIDNTDGGDESGLTLTNGGVIGLGAGNFTRSVGLNDSQVQWTGSGGFAAYNATRTVTLGNSVNATQYWGSGSFVPDGERLILSAVGSTNQINFANQINLGSGQRTIQVDNGSQTLDAQMTGVISGPGGVTKTGAGALYLSAANTYTGRTRLEEGSFRIANEGNLGTNTTFAADQLTFAGGTLRLEAIATIDDPNRGIYIADEGGTIRVVGGAARTLTFNGGPISGTALGDLTIQNDADDTVQFNVANSYTGRTILTLGMLYITNENQLGSNPDAFVADQLRMNGGTLRVADQVVIDDSNRGISNAAAATFDVDGSSLLNISNVIAGGGSLTKIGLGLLALNASNTYTGITAIRNGTLALASEAGLGDNPSSYNAAQLVISNNATLRATESFAIDDANRGIRLDIGSNTVGGIFDIDPGVTLDVSNHITGSGGLTKVGAGTLLLNNPTNFFGAGVVSNSPTHWTTGQVTIAQGTVGIAAEQSLGTNATAFFNPTAVLVSNGGVLRAVSSLVMDDPNRGITIGDGGGFLSADAATTLNVSNLIAGDAVNALGKIGAGLVLLNNSNNTYSGRTVIAEGTLGAASEGALGSNTSFVADQLLVSNGGVFRATATFAIDDPNRGITVGTGGGGIEVDASRTLTISNSVVGDNLSKSGSGALILDGSESVLAGLSNLAGTSTLRGLTNLVDRLVGNAGTINLHGGFNVITGVVLNGGADINFGDDTTDVTRVEQDLIVNHDAAAGASAVTFSAGTNEIFGSVLAYSGTNQNAPTLSFFADRTIVLGDVFLGRSNGAAFGAGGIDFGNAATDSTEIYGNLVLDAAGKASTTAHEFSRGDLVVRSNIIVNASGMSYLDIGGSANHGGSRLIIEADEDVDYGDSVGFFSRLRDGTLAQGPDGIVVGDYANLEIDLQRTNDTYYIGQRLTISNSGPTFWFTDGRGQLQFNGVSGSGTPVVMATNLALFDGSYLRIREDNLNVRAGLMLTGFASSGSAYLGAGGTSDPFDLVDVRAGVAGQAWTLQIGTTNGRIQAGAVVHDDVPLVSTLFGSATEDITFDVFNGRLIMTNGANIAGVVKVTQAGSVFEVGATTTGSVREVQVLAGQFRNSGDLMEFSNVVVGASAEAFLDGQVSYFTNLSLDGVANVLSPNIGVGKLTVDGGTMRVISNYTLNAAQSVTLASGGGTFQVADGRALLVSNVMDGAGGLTKTGPGTMTLSGTASNSYAGQTVVSDGTLALSKLAGMNAIVGDGISNKSSADILINGGTLLWQASHQLDNSVSILLTTGGVMNINGKTDTIYDFRNYGGTYRAPRGSKLTVVDPLWAGGSTNEILGNDVYGSHEISGGFNRIHGDEGYGFGGGSIEIGAGGLVFSGNDSPSLILSADHTNAGSLKLSGDVSFTGTAGTAEISSGPALVDVDGTGTAWNNDPDQTGTLAGFIDLNGATRTFTVADGSATSDMRISAMLTNSAGTVGGINKAGAGTMELTGTNMYDGQTTVSAGTLLVNGDNTLASAVGSVMNGATLGGSGILGGDTHFASGSTNMPGMPGVADVLTYAGGLMHSNGSTLLWELFVNSEATRGPDFDGIDISGGEFFIESGALMTLVFNGGGSAVDWSDTFWASNRTWLVADIDFGGGATTNSATSEFSIANALFLDAQNDNLNSLYTGAGFWTYYDETTGDLYLQYAVPEPASWVLVLASIGLTLWIRRRRARA